MLHDAGMAALVRMPEKSLSIWSAQMDNDCMADVCAVEQ
jgi:hypothetical protein